jgi:hypothetical protein
MDFLQAASALCYGTWKLWIATWRELCVPIINAAVREVLSLCLESFRNALIQSAMRTTLLRISAQCVGRSVLSAVSTHADGHCLSGRCGNAVLRRDDAAEAYGVRQMGIVYGRGYMRCNPWLPTLFVPGTRRRRPHRHPHTWRSACYGADPEMVETVAAVF